MSEAAAKPPRMTVEEFLVWAEARAGRYELLDGEVVTMQSERVAHVIVKMNAYSALRDAIRASGVSCRTFGDGITVKIASHTAFEPDCTIHCGPIDMNGLLATNPVVVAEVLSPSTQSVDLVKKLPEYFRVATIMHYLIIDPDKRMVIQHSRNGDLITTRFLHANEGGGGTLRLDPPGIAVEIADFFADLDDEG
jgi:Uma2 family endonuclease